MQSSFTLMPNVVSAILLFSLGIISGCTESDNSEECESAIVTDVEITGLQTTINYAIDSVNIDGVAFLTRVEGPAISYMDYVLGVQAEIVNSVSADLSLFRQYLMRNAMASCIPPGELNTSVSEIVSMDITSDKSFGDDHPAGTSLNDIFGIYALSDVEDGRGDFVENIDSLPTISDYLLNASKAPIVFYLKLIQSPDVQEEHVFSINYILRSGASYSINSEPMAFTFVP